MSANVSRYIARETAVSVVINAVLSALFYLAIFHGRDPVPLWGMDGLVIDCLPQSFMIGLMATLVPSLLTRRAQAAGRIPGMTAAQPTGRILRRAVGFALLCAAAGVGLAALAARASGAAALPFLPGLGLKVAFGSLLARVITPSALRAMLRPDPSAPSALEGAF